MERIFESGPLPRAPQAAPRATHSRAPPDALPRERLGARDPGNAFQAAPDAWPRAGNSQCFSAAPAAGWGRAWAERGASNTW